MPISKLSDVSAPLGGLASQYVVSEELGVNRIVLSQDGRQSRVTDFLPDIHIPLDVVLPQDVLKETMGMPSVASVLVALNLEGDQIQGYSQKEAILFRFSNIDSIRMARTNSVVISVRQDTTLRLSKESLKRSGQGVEFLYLDEGANLTIELTTLLMLDRSSKILKSEFIAEPKTMSIGNVPTPAEKLKLERLLNSIRVVGYTFDYRYGDLTH